MKASDNISTSNHLRFIPSPLGFTTKKDAVDIAQALLDGELIEDMTNILKDDVLGGPIFSAGIPYKLKERKRTKSIRDTAVVATEEDIIEESETNSEEEGAADDLDPEWLQNMELPRKDNVTPKLDVNKVLKQSPSGAEEMSSPVEHEDLNVLLDSSSMMETSSEIPCPALDEVYSKHQETYLNRLLTVEKLDKSKWKEFIKSNCDKLLKEVELVPEVNPWTNEISMDIRDLIKVKCISNGHQNDSRIIIGEVFTNRVIRNDMPMSSSRAKMLLVQDAISYHRYILSPLMIGIIVK